MRSLLSLFTIGGMLLTLVCMGVQEVNLTPLDGSAKVEAHRKYIDIQSPITGDETIGQMTMDAERLALPFDEKNIVLFT